MKILGSLSVALVVGAAGLQAQTLQSGTWTGSIMPPDAPRFEATYAVAVEGDSITISITIPQIGETARFYNIEVRDDRLLFSWTAGTTPLTCDLPKQDDGSYAGDCVDEDGEPGQLVMIPPGHGEGH